jgi:hypothetical protein
MDTQLAAERAEQTPTSIQPSSFHKLEDLPAHKQQELRELLQLAKEQRNQPQPVSTAQLHPSVAQVVQQMQTNEGPIIVDDLSGPRQPLFTRTPQPAGPATPPTPTQPAATATMASQAGTFDAPKICPRCNYDCNHEFTATPTEEDRKNFLVALLSQKRFTKLVPIFNTGLTITFRTLTSKEAMLVFEQLTYDTKAGRVNTQAEYLAKLMDYRMCLSVEAIRAKDGRVLAQVPELFDIPYDPPASGERETPLVPMLSYITTDVLTQEPIRRVAGQQQRQFQRIVETLEAQAAEPSFWQGIDTQA